MVSYMVFLATFWLQHLIKKCWLVSCSMPWSQIGMLLTPVLWPSSFNMWVSWRSSLQYDMPASWSFWKTTLLPTFGIICFVKHPIVSWPHFLCQDLRAMSEDSLTAVEKEMVGDASTLPLNITCDNALTILSTVSLASIPAWLGIHVRCTVTSILQSVFSLSFYFYVWKGWGYGHGDSMIIILIQLTLTVTLSQTQ